MVAILVLHSVDASAVEGTCKAAADNNKHVNKEFCMQELSKHPDSPHADTWGLAKVAAAVGAINAMSSVADIKALQTKPGTDDKTMEVLVQCQVFYTDVDYSFNRARDQINRLNYGPGRGRRRRTLPPILRGTASTDSPRLRFHRLSRCTAGTLSR
ncbi:hypothetical protein BAE44_0000483 [Dichanthelium oligosanthes]|uniref:Pectinesterase inhibitor domain-containing protein n=1 Tax=Dichanthelium oligosanthes TaxID=888268 RepID=A0A1E5WM90_9POAL|nr:hypothetical protein BAE44_0000483 [Dichanthelium oligosanthes]